MRLAIITINYNDSENTINLLESLRNQTDKDFEIYVVDNDSKDVDQLMDYKTTETNIVYIKNDRNLGFSGGNNVGIRKAFQNGANWVLLLNNDTMPESHLVEHLRVDLEGREGIVGLPLNEGNGTAFGGQIQWLKPTLRHSYNQTKMDETQAYVIGGAMLIHEDVFNRIGLLDEKYFLYFEDADFCQRARKAKIPISFISDIKTSHAVSSSTKKLGSPLLMRYHYRNALYFNLKNGPLYVKLLVWPWSWLVMLKQIIKIVIGKNREQSVAILKGVGDWYTGKMGKIKNGI